MLRRDDDQYGSQATIDSGIRHTVDVGLANNFQRGAGYRCSLQDLNSRVSFSSLYRSIGLFNSFELYPAG